MTPNATRNVTNLFRVRLACGALNLAFSAALSMVIPAPVQASAGVLLTGSSTVAPLAATLAVAYERQHPGVRIDVQTGGSSKGVADCLGGLSDLGMISRDVKPSETGVEGIAIARDGLGFLVNTSAGVDGLSPEQIKGIYRGTITNWKEVGGADQKIVPVSKAEGRATLEVFKEFFHLTSSQIKAGAIVGDEAHDVKTVASTPGAIGYMGLSTIEQTLQGKNARAPQRVVALRVAGVAPGRDTLRAKTYPYGRKLHLVRCRALRPEAQSFVDFVLSPKGQKVVSDAGYTPL